jgi:hypothetical protein
LLTLIHDSSLASVQKQLILVVIGKGLLSFAFKICHYASAFTHIGNASALLALVHPYQLMRLRLLELSLGFIDLAL